MLLIIFISTVVSYTQCANILGVFMYPSINHQTIFQQIWKELSLRGHQVTVVTPDPLNDPTLTNLTEISVHFAYDVLNSYARKDPFFESIESFEDMADFYHLLDLIAERELRSFEFKNLLRSEKKFDLILIELIHPVMYILGHRFNAPVIAISASSTFSVYYDAVGNPNHPVLYPDPIWRSNYEILSMWQKIKSLTFFLWNKFHYHWVFVRNAHETAMSHFGENIPYIGDLERNVSLIFINRNLLLDLPRPNVPAVVEISPLNAKTSKSIPKDLKNTLDDATDGTIYFNFGGNLTCNYLLDKLETTLQALSELPYLFVWKWNCDFNLPRKLSNVIIQEPTSQNNILTHPNIKALVTRGELHDVEEAIMYEVPLISLYVRNEPPYTQRVIDLGIGAKLDLENLTKIELKNVLIKVAEKKSYKYRIVKASKILLDQPMTGLEKVIFWSENVIKSKGARYLRSAAVDMPWYEYMLLDVLLFLLTLILLGAYLNYKLLFVIGKLLGWITPKQKEIKLKKN